MTQSHSPDNKIQQWLSYDASGQPRSWKTRRNQTKTMSYDARGRELSHSWDDGAAPSIARSWDDANRLTSITNIWSSIDYSYDDAGQVLWEGDEIAGSGGRTQTNYSRYPDGSVAHLHYPGGTYLRKDYTARGQLAAVGWDDDDDNWWKKLAAYTYLPDAKVGQIDFGNGIRTGYGYDGRGMIQVVDHYLPGVQDISWRQYWRDGRDRITAWVKGETGRGDHYAYDDEGQLTDGWYNATDPNGNFQNWTRRDHFSYDALGNRQGGSNNLASRNSGLSAISFLRRDNGLNQYAHWWPAGVDYIIYHDDNFGSPYVYPGNGVTMADGWLVASYNALNQPVAMWSFAYQGTPNYVWFGYDPLGRCVKRWVGESGDVYSNPATYFHYDGWNLLQEGNNAWGPARVYAHGNRVDEIVWSYNTFTGEQAFHHYDARGHCTLLTDSGGYILEQYEYDAFGQPYFYDAAGAPATVNGQPGSPFGNRFLFTGREWLSDVRLYDFRNRMYQPELGRFLQPDPKEFAAGDYNLYRYCHNDPVNRSDPFGLIDRDIDKDLDKRGVEASQNSLKEAKADSIGRSQVVQEKDGQRSLGSKFGKGETSVEQKMVNGRLQPITTQKEKAPVDDGHKAVAVGHAHMDATGKAETRFSGADIARAKGSATDPGIPVYKVNESNPSVILRLTPQINYRDEPTIRQVSP
jgi:RHS repeat-associated protein